MENEIVRSKAFYEIMDLVNVHQYLSQVVSPTKEIVHCREKVEKLLLTKIDSLT